MIKYFLLLIVMLFAEQALFAQSEIYLQNKRREGKIRKIDPGKQYTVHTGDSVYRHYLLSLANDSTLSLSREEAGKVHFVEFDDVIYLEKVPKSGFFEVIAYTGMVLLSITPVVWIFDGGEEALGTLQGVGLLAAISVPFILVKNVGKKKDMIRDWSIKVRSQE